MQQAIDAGMLIHGHTLVWTAMSQTPDWMYYRDGALANGFLSREEALDNLRTHITTVVKHFNEKFNTEEERHFISWDVVNEAMESFPIADVNESNWQEALNPRIPWVGSIGFDYVEQAFLAARYADPDAILYYNDYYLENPLKRAAGILHG